MRPSILTAAVLLVALIGCNKPTALKVEHAEKVAVTKPDWKLVTLHIDGFKKSKSGGT
jgi:hypothetical protein